MQQFCDLAIDLELFTIAYNPIQGSQLTLAKTAISGLRGTHAALPGHKLYIATTPGVIHYVGRTTNILRRLRLGHQRRINPLNGYHGYKWLPLTDLHLFVCHLSGLEALATAASIAPELLVESLEAEIVFHIRGTTNQWPISQHEIHFHNLTDIPGLSTLTIATAQAIYEEVASVNSKLIASTL